MRLRERWKLGEIRQVLERARVSAALFFKQAPGPNQKNFVSHPIRAGAADFALILRVDRGAESLQCKGSFKSGGYGGHPLNRRGSENF